ncbi:hypothetical protein AAFN88_16630 [Pelagibius sp. CAU 1746]|uniref:hypothetical protein n=1 Tax=Pelagibius sp. CAU 1746 TaxID=3140370 RepID=UPI00325BCA58
MANDVSISVFNKTANRDLFITIFQKPQTANPNVIYTSLFPVAWEVLALGPNQTADPVVYPVQLQLQVTEHNSAINAIRRKTLQDVDEGQVWSFKRPGVFSELTQSGKAKGVDGVVVCQNNSTEFIDVGIAKNGSMLTVQEDLAEGEQADFQLTPKLYFLALSNLQKGDIIRSDQVTQGAFEVDLTNLQSIDVTVTTSNVASGKLAWATSNAVAAS